MALKRFERTAFHRVVASQASVRFRTRPHREMGTLTLPQNGVFGIGMVLGLLCVAMDFTDIYASKASRTAHRFFTRNAGLRKRTSLTIPCLDTTPMIVLRPIHPATPIRKTAA